MKIPVFVMALVITLLIGLGIVFFVLLPGS